MKCLCDGRWSNITYIGRQLVQTEKQCKTMYMQSCLPSLAKDVELDEDHSAVLSGPAC